MDAKQDNGLDEPGDPVPTQSTVPKKRTPPKRLYRWTIEELNDIIDKFNRGDVSPKEKDRQRTKK